MSMDGNTCCKGAEPVEEEEREPDCSLATEKGEDDTHEVSRVNIIVDLQF